MASHVIAEGEGSPERFLLKVLKPLVTAGILRSLKGPNGGYQLAKSPADVSILDIVEAVDGPMRGHVSFNEGAGNLDRRLQVVYDQATDAVRGQLQKIHISDLAKK